MASNDMDSYDNTAVPAVVASPAPPDGFISLDYSNHVHKRLLAPGTGDVVCRPGATVQVHYTGSLYPSGEVFDSSISRGQPIQFRLGQGMVLKGWDVGISTMLIGEKASLLIAPEYGYGSQGSPPKIPGNATLLFDVELISVDVSTAEKTTSEKLASAELLKDEGNNYFKHGEMDQAKQIYISASELLRNTWGSTTTDDEAIKQLRIILDSNLAAVHLRLKDYQSAVDCCTRIRDVSTAHPKAIYRLSQAFTGLSRFNEAIDLLQFNRDVLVDVDVDLEISQIRQKLHAQAVKEKDLYTKMFK
ncbi:hypothetical protein BASA81_016375 [Batrachochytrium salamandrivorans]|nr:hypothetical protein BASA81_016375 [Batrachochytrium salamandrivorans]